MGISKISNWQEIDSYENEDTGEWELGIKWGKIVYFLSEFMRCELRKDEKSDFVIHGTAGISNTGAIAIELSDDCNEARTALLT